MLSDQRYRGVAPKARLVVLKVLDENGQGYTSDVIDAIEFVTKYKSRLGVDIINLSLGHPILEPAATDPLVQAVEAAVRAGIVVVAAAGNVGVSPSTGEPGYAGILSPGNAPSAITVGSARTFDTNLRSDDRVADYSSRGPTWYDARAKPDLVAPGDGLVAAAAKSSTLYVNHPTLRVDDDYLRLNGTSMATAVVSGTAALILQANHALTPNAVKAILQFTALPVRDEQGAGTTFSLRALAASMPRAPSRWPPTSIPEGRLVMVADHHTGSLDGHRRTGVVVGGEHRLARRGQLRPRGGCQRAGVVREHRVG